MAVVDGPIAESVDYNKMAAELESQELEAPGGVATAALYSQLLTVYLIQNDLPNMKYLWKRIPTAVKSSTPELALVWSVGQALWQRDFPLIYEQIHKEWSELIKPLMEVLEQTTRRRAFSLVSNGYSSIAVSNLCELLGLQEAEAIAMATGAGWHYDAASSMVHPKKQDNSLCTGISTNHHLARLTDFVTFLEN